MEPTDENFATLEQKFSTEIAELRAELRIEQAAAIDRRDETLSNELKEALRQSEELLQQLRSLRRLCAGVLSTPGGFFTAEEIDALRYFGFHPSEQVLEEMSLARKRAQGEEEQQQQQQQQQQQSRDRSNSGDGDKKSSQNRKQQQQEGHQQQAQQLPSKSSNVVRHYETIPIRVGGSAAAPHDTRGDDDQQNQHQRNKHSSVSASPQRPSVLIPHVGYVPPIRSPARFERETDEVGVTQEARMEAQRQMLQRDKTAELAATRSPPPRPQQISSGYYNNSSVNNNNSTTSNQVKSSPPRRTIATPVRQSYHSSSSASPFRGSSPPTHDNNNNPPSPALHQVERHVTHAIERRVARASPTLVPEERYKLVKEVQREVLASDRFASVVEDAIQQHHRHQHTDKSFSAAASASFGVGGGSNLVTTSELVTALREDNLSLQRQIARMQQRDRDSDARSGMHMGAIGKVSSPKSPTRGAGGSSSGFHFTTGAAPTSSPSLGDRKNNSNNNRSPKKTTSSSINFDHDEQQHHNNTKMLLSRIRELEQLNGDLKNQIKSAVGAVNQLGGTSPRTLRKTVSSLDRVLAQGHAALRATQFLRDPNVVYESVSNNPEADRVVSHFVKQVNNARPHLQDWVGVLPFVLDTQAGVAHSITGASVPCDGGSDPANTALQRFLISSVGDRGKKRHHSGGNNYSSSQHHHDHQDPHLTSAAAETQSFIRVHNAAARSPSLGGQVGGRGAVSATATPLSFSSSSAADVVPNNHRHATTTAMSRFITTPHDDVNAQYAHNNTLNHSSTSLSRQQQGLSSSDSTGGLVPPPPPRTDVVKTSYHQQLQQASGSVRTPSVSQGRPRGMDDGDDDRDQMTMMHSPSPRQPGGGAGGRAGGVLEHQQQQSPPAAAVGSSSARKPAGTTNWLRPPGGVASSSTTPQSVVKRQYQQQQQYHNSNNSLARDFFSTPPRDDGGMTQRATSVQQQQQMPVPLATDLDPIDSGASPSVELATLHRLQQERDALMELQKRQHQQHQQLRSGDGGGGLVPDASSSSKAPSGSFASVSPQRVGATTTGTTGIHRKPVAARVVEQLHSTSNNKATAATAKPVTQQSLSVLRSKMSSNNNNNNNNTASSTASSNNNIINNKTARRSTSRPSSSAAAPPSQVSATRRFVDATKNEYVAETRGRGKSDAGGDNNSNNNDSILSRVGPDVLRSMTQSEIEVLKRVALTQQLREQKRREQEKQQRFGR